ncbi:MAG: nucleoside-triphosphatase [Calditrichota bacterium]
MKIFLNKKNILITGRPGIGKTSFILSLADQLNQIKPAGFFTREIRKGGSRAGFSISTFDGFEKILAHQALKSSIRVSKYGVDIKAIDQVIDHIMETSRSPDLWFIDEIGKMESFSEKFRNFINQILREKVSVIATIALHSTGWIEQIKKRPDIHLLELTEANRNCFINELEKALQ